MGASVKVTGDRALLAAFDQFPKKFANKGIKQVLKEVTTDVVLRDAQRTVPTRTGLLQKSLKVRTAKGRNGKRLPRGVMGFSVQSVKTKRTDAYYAGWVFLGAKSRNGIKRAGSRTLRRALYENADVARARVRAGLRLAVKKVANAVRIATAAKG